MMGILMGGIASAMLLAGGLGGLQQGAVLGSVPFIVISVALMWYWVGALRKEPRPTKLVSPQNLDATGGLVSTAPPDVPDRTDDLDGEPQNRTEEA